MLPVVPEVPRTQEQQYAAAILHELRAIRALLEPKLVVNPPGIATHPSQLPGWGNPSTVETPAAPIPASPDPKQRGKPRKG